MQVQPLSADERNDILRRNREALEARKRLVDQGDFPGATAYTLKAEQAKDEYFKRVPRITMSRCPFDGKPLIRTFDPYGLDGFWWSPDVTPKELPCCPHFCVLRGAVHFAGQKPRGVRFQAQPGPEVPYVLPRLLEYDGMVAVISRLRMTPGYLAYPIAYFAERRPPAEELTADWARGSYTYETTSGETGWLAPTDLWDFELEPWLKAGKLRWCDPDSADMTLSADPAQRCPYLNLPGERQRILVEGDVSWTAGLPDGEPVSPFE